ncbi:MAG: FAD-dependent oxidoreductase, partial [Cyanobacteria bacterium P01_D01_bin.14]
MAVDYDLVIMGGTLAGRQAAIAASQTGARVVLVEPPNVVRQQIEADNLRRHLHQSGTWPDHSGFSPLPPGLLDWEGLAGRGVDLLVGEPQLLSADLPTFQVAERRLSARAGLLAMDC